MPRLIDVDVLRERMYHDAFETDSDMQKWDSGCWIRYKMFENALDEQPTVDAEPVKHGHWEKVKEQPYFRKHFHNVACSECHREGIENWNYCPNCGARMDEVEE